MTVLLRTSEDDKSIILHWISTELLDVVDNWVGVPTQHPTVLVEGSIRLTIKGEKDQEFKAPHTLTLPINTSYRITALTQNVTVDCFYDKASGAADEVRYLMAGHRKIVDGKPTTIWPKGSPEFESSEVPGRTGSTGPPA